jgi:xylulose-5-phosphate/fructose-6-phosphate phosphoketolase
MDAAIEHLALGASVWEWASNVPEGEEPDIVLGCAGDIPTLETVAAAQGLRENAPELKVRGSALRAGWRLAPSK